MSCHKASHLPTLPWPRLRLKSLLAAHFAADHKINSVHAPTPDISRTNSPTFIFIKFSALLIFSRGSVVVQHTRGLNTCAVIRCYSTPCQSRSEEVAGSIPAHGAHSFFCPLCRLCCSSFCISFVVPSNLAVSPLLLLTCRSSLVSNIFILFLSGCLVYVTLNLVV